MVKDDFGFVRVFRFLKVAENKESVFSVDSSFGVAIAADCFVVVFFEAVVDVATLANEDLSGTIFQLKGDRTLIVLYCDPCGVSVGVPFFSF